MRASRDLRHHGFAALAGLTFLLVALSQAVVGRTALQAVWRGYTTLVVSGDAPLAEVVGRLERGYGRSRLVSALTSTVSVTTFGGREEVPVAELGRRLETRDPRFDPYMRKLPAMFEARVGGRAYHVLYLRTGLVSAFASARIGRLLSGLGGEWWIAELPSTPKVLFLMAGLLFLVILVGGIRGVASALYLAAAALPWLLNCLVGTVGDLLAYFVVFPFCCAFLREARSRWRSGGPLRLADLAGPGRLDSLVSLGAAAAAAGLVALALGGARDTTRVLTALASDGLLLAAVVAWDRGRSVPSSHRIFVPVPIGWGLYRAARLPRPRLAAALRALVTSAHWLALTRTAQVGALLAVVCLSPFLSLFGRGGRADAVPAPGLSGAPRVTWESLKQLWVVSAADGLPTVADFVAHESYQTAIAFGAPYHLPARNERVTLAEFRPEKGGPAMVEQQKTVVLYTDRWLRDTLSRAEPASVGRLLSAQRRAARVQVVVGRSEPAPRPEFWKIGLYSAMVVAFLALGSRYLRPSLFSGGSRTTLIRRRQHA